MSASQCYYCSSTLFHEEDGLIRCENGHTQEGGQRAGDDENDYTAAGRINRKKIEKSKEKIVRIHRGPKGFRLYLKAWQFVLWKQCYTLVHSLGLPANLWTVVRELWSLRLSQFADRLEDVSETVQQPERDMTDTKPRQDLEIDVELEDGKLTTARSITANPTLWDTIALNYIGILVLRQPVSLATIYKSLRDESVCFIRAIRHLPGDVRERLAPEYYAALDTVSIPQRHDLHNAIVRLVAAYQTAFGVNVPSLNWLPILLENVRKLSLPLEVFTAAKHIARKLKFDFSYLVRQGRRKTSTSLPEAQLVAALIVATKLLFPFDCEGTTTYPSSMSEPAALQMDWTKWLQSRKQLKSDVSSDLGREKSIEVTDRDVMEMSEEQLDQYMDWFQASYASEPKTTTNLNRAILEMFPLKKLPVNETALPKESLRQEAKIHKRLIASQSQLGSVQAVAQDATATENVSRPGQKYQRFKTVEDLSDVGLSFHQEAADTACLDLNDLLPAVWRTERLLLLTQFEQHRSEVFAGDVDVEFKHEDLDQ